MGHERRSAQSSRGGTGQEPQFTSGEPPPPPPKPPLQRRSSDREFREVLGVGLGIVRKSLIIVALFSFVVNTLVLAVPLYLFQISDRVLTSRSLDTLVMLSIVAVGFLCISLLDTLRRSSMLAGWRQLKPSGRPGARARQRRTTAQVADIQTLRDLHQVKAS